MLRSVRGLAGFAVEDEGSQASSNKSESEDKPCTRNTLPAICIPKTRELKS